MAKKRSSRKGRPVPKTVLRLPDLDQAKAAVLNSLSSHDAQRGYRHAIDEFIQWYCSEPRLSFSKVVVTRFRIALENRGLAAGTINGRLAAVRRLASISTRNNSLTGMAYWDSGKLNDQVLVAEPGHRGGLIGQIGG